MHAVKLLFWQFLSLVTRGINEMYIFTSRKNEFALSQAYTKANMADPHGSIIIKSLSYCWCLKVKVMPNISKYI